MQAWLDQCGIVEGMLAKLDGAGLHVDVGQLSAINDVLLMLVGHRRELPDANVIVAHLTPVLAANAHEQVLIGQLLNAYWAERLAADRASVAWFRFLRRIRIASVLVLIFASVSQYAYVHCLYGPIKKGCASTSTEITKPTGTNGTTAVQKPGPEEEFVDVPAGVPSLSLPQKGLVLLPLLLGTLGIWMLRREVRTVGSQPSRVAPSVQTSLRLAIDPVTRRLISPSTLWPLVQRLRIPRTFESRRVDVSRTVWATARSGLQPQIRYTSLRIPCDYVLLIDQVSFTDHQAQLFLSMAEQLSSNDLRVEVYVFAGTPLYCWRHGMPAHQIDLFDVLSANVDASVIIAADTRCLIDMRTRRPFSWLSMLEDRPMRVVLAPQGSQSTKHFDAALADERFFVLPATEAGLRQFAGVMEQLIIADGPRRVARNFRYSALAPLPAIISHDPMRWLSPVPQPDVEDLKIELYVLLGHRKYIWLAATALFPVHWWQWTMRVGDIVGRTEVQNKAVDTVAGFGAAWPDHDALLELARLPWMRHGFMPEYLRESLVGELNGDTREAVKLCIADMIVRGEVARAKIGSDGTFHDIDLTKLTDRQRKALLDEARKILADLPPEERDVYRHIIDLVDAGAAGPQINGGIGEIFDPLPSDALRREYKFWMSAGGLALAAGAASLLVFTQLPRQTPLKRVSVATLLADHANKFGLLYPQLAQAEEIANQIRDLLSGPPALRGPDTRLGDLVVSNVIHDAQNLNPMDGATINKLSRISKILSELPTALWVSPGVRERFSRVVDAADADLKALLRPVMDNLTSAPVSTSDRPTYQACVDKKLLPFRDERKTFSQQGRVDCPSAGIRGGGNHREDVVRFDVPDGYRLNPNRPPRVQVVSNNNGSFNGPVYVPDQETARTVTVDISCHSPSVPFGPGAWIEIELKGELERVPSSGEQEQAAVDCSK